MKKLAISIMVLGAVALSANATVTYSLSAAMVYSDAGNTLLPMNSLVAFIADVDGDGFGNWATTQLGGTGFTIDDDDVLLAIGPSGESMDGAIVGTYVFTSAGYTGKEWAMVWFDTAYADGITGAGENVKYGVFEGGEVIPSEGSTITDFFWMTEDTGSGSLANDTFNVIYTTAGVPEPMTVTLLLVGGGLLAARRNAKRKCA